MRGIGVYIIIVFAVICIWYWLSAGATSNSYTQSQFEKDRQRKLMDIIAGVKSDNAGVMAQEILDRVLLDTGGYAMDDMTVVAIGIWEK